MAAHVIMSMGVACRNEYLRFMQYIFIIWESLFEIIFLESKNVRECCLRLRPIDENISRTGYFEFGDKSQKIPGQDLGWAGDNAQPHAAKAKPILSVIIWDKWRK